MNTQFPESEILAIIDKEKIREVLYRYARGIDRGDEEILKSVFHEDAIDEHASAFIGNAYDWCRFAAQQHPQIHSLQHFICNSLIELKGDHAFVESYGFAFHRLEKDGAPFDCFMGVRLLDRFEKRNGEWKIAHRRVILDWSRDVEMSETWGRGVLGSPEVGAYRGKRDKSDPSYSPA